MLKLLYVFLLQSVIALIVYKWQDQLHLYKVIIFASIKVITKLPNSEQPYKGKVQTHNYTNRQNQSTTGKLWKPQWPWLGTGTSKEMVGRTRLQGAKPPAPTTAQRLRLPPQQHPNTGTKQAKHLSKQHHTRWRKCQKHPHVTHWQKNYWHPQFPISIHLHHMKMHRS